MYDNKFECFDKFWRNSFFDLITQHTDISDTTIRIRALELSSIAICYLINHESLSQRIILRIMSKSLIDFRKDWNKKY